MLDPNEVAGAIRRSFADGRVELRDMTGGGDHYEIRLVSETFAGKSLIERHRMVHRALAGLMDSGALHAIKLKTLTPAESGTK